LPRNRIDKPSERNFDSIFSCTAETIRSRFLTEIRENKKIVVTKCPNCGMVGMPARSTCVKSFAGLKEFVEVGDTSTVTTYSVINTFREFYPLKPPSIFGMIHLGGADNGWVPMMGDVNPKDMEIGKVAEVKFIKIL
jgi:uncharacterized OB-fold protein